MIKKLLLASILTINFSIMAHENLFYGFGANSHVIEFQDDLKDDYLLIFTSYLVSGPDHADASLHEIIVKEKCEYDFKDEELSKMKELAENKLTNHSTFGDMLNYQYEMEIIESCDFTSRYYWRNQRLINKICGEANGTYCINSQKKNTRFFEQLHHWDTDNKLFVSIKYDLDAKKAFVTKYSTSEFIKGIEEKEKVFNDEFYFSLRDYKNLNENDTLKMLFKSKIEKRFLLTPKNIDFLFEINVFNNGIE